jgi:hypothetical protein
MPKFQVKQINLTDTECDEVNASTNPYAIPKYIALIKSMEGNYELGLSGGFYETVAEIEATNLEHVYLIGNMGPEESITRLARMHSISVGDLIVDSEGQTYVVAQFGYDKVA